MPQALDGLSHRHAAFRTIGRHDSGEGYREILTRMARESGIETPTAEDLVRLDRTLSNADWQSSTDPDARIAKLASVVIFMIRPIPLG